VIPFAIMGVTDCSETIRNRLNGSFFKFVDSSGVPGGTRTRVAAPWLTRTGRTPPVPMPPRTRSASRSDLPAVHNGLGRQLGQLRCRGRALHRTDGDAPRGSRAAAGMGLATGCPASFGTTRQVPIAPAATRLGMTVSMAVRPGPSLSRRSRPLVRLTPDCRYGPQPACRADPRARPAAICHAMAREPEHYALYLRSLWSFFHALYFSVCGMRPNRTARVTLRDTPFKSDQSRSAVRSPERPGAVRPSLDAGGFRGSALPHADRARNSGPCRDRGGQFGHTTRSRP
jgi:hypothetical protein